MKLYLWLVNCFAGLNSSFDMNETSTIMIRSGQVGDADHLLAIARGACQQFVAEMGKEPAPMLTNYDQHLAEDDVMVAMTEDNKIAGFAVLIHKPDGCWLENIAVDASLKGQGIGNLLLHHIEDGLVQRGINTIRLYTNVVMRQNMAWYQRHGYREYDRKQDEGYERVYFMKALEHVSA